MQQAGTCLLPTSQKAITPHPTPSFCRYGACTLLSSNELAAGSPPSYSDFAAATVPLASGWVLSDAKAAAAATQPVATTTTPPAGAFAAQPAAEPEPRVSAQGAGRKLFQV